MEGSTDTAPPIMLKLSTERINADSTTNRCFSSADSNTNWQLLQSGGWSVAAICQNTALLSSCRLTLSLCYFILRDRSRPVCPTYTFSQPRQGITYTPPLALGLVLTSLLRRLLEERWVMWIFCERKMGFKLVLVKSLNGRLIVGFRLSSGGSIEWL